MVMLGCSSWDAGSLLLCKSAVGIEVTYLNEEADPFPRPGSVPGYYTKVIWLQIMERLPPFWGFMTWLSGTVCGWV